MNKNDYLEGISRAFFIIVAVFAFIGLAWSGEYRSALGNFLYITHIVILLFLAAKSRKLIQKNIYLFINVFGLCIAIYFIITESIYLFILGVIGFVIMLFFSSFHLSRGGMHK